MTVLTYQPETVPLDLPWLTAAEQAELDALIGHEYERRRCADERAHFIDAHCQIKAKAADTADDKAPATWQPFHLWPAQREIVTALDTGDHLILLKARQLGMTWLILACILWQMLFRPVCTVLLFSRREQEAYDLLKRLTAMFAHLPPWLQSTAGGVRVDSASVWALGNGSEARAFPTTAGDSYTAQIALCDEFDLGDNQDALLEAVGPTVVESGQLVLLSRVDKDKPLSTFKRLYQQARAGALPGWRAIFLPWQARPGRTPEWHAARVAESLATDGTLDTVQAQYPATDAEALAQRSGNKRLPAAWLTACWRPAAPAPDPAAPPVPALVVYAPPVPDARYVVGADPAEGNPTSDESAATVVDKATGAQVAVLAGRVQPDEFARALAQVAAYYHGAGVLVERNNHGHAVLLALQGRALCLVGNDGKPGWLTTGPSKALAYDNAALCLREGDAGLTDLATFQQLGSIEGATLSAPAGQHDDRAMAWVLAQQARATRRVMAVA